MKYLKSIGPIAQIVSIIVGNANCPGWLGGMNMVGSANKILSVKGYYLKFAKVFLWIIYVKDLKRKKFSGGV